MKHILKYKDLFKTILYILSIMIIGTNIVKAEPYAEHNEAYKYVSDEENHKVTFKMPINEDSDISGDVYILYKGEKTDVYMVLSDLNNYSASQLVPQGKYRISSITNATNKEAYKYKSIDEFIVDDKDVEVYIHISDKNNNSLNNLLIKDNIKEDKLMTFNIDKSKEQEEELRKSRMITNILITIDIVILISLIAIFIYSKNIKNRTKNSRKEKNHAGNSKVV